MAKPKNELVRLKEAKKNKKRFESDEGGENPIYDGPNPVLDAMGLKIAEDLAEKIGMEKLKRVFPDMAALLEE